MLRSCTVTSAAVALAGVGTVPCNSAVLPYSCTADPLHPAAISCHRGCTLHMLVLLTPTFLVTRTVPMIKIVLLPLPPPLLLSPPRPLLLPPPGLVKGDRRLEVDALLDRAGMRSAEVVLPLIRHAPGFDKYRWAPYCKLHIVQVLCEQLGYGCELVYKLVNGCDAAMADISHPPALTLPFNLPPHLSLTTPLHPCCHSPSHSHSQGPAPGAKTHEAGHDTFITHKPHPPPLTPPPPSSPFNPTPRGLPPGAKAHEAGYDAFMTGAAFACLLPLLRAKAAADPAAFAALVAGSGTGTRVGTQQLETQEGEGQRGEAAAASESAVAAAESVVAAAESAVAAAAGVIGRVNLTYSDMPYVALWGEDPLPQRPRMVHLSWEEGALSDGDGNGGGGEAPRRRGDVAKSLVRRLQRPLPMGEDGRAAKVGGEMVLGGLSW